MHTSIRQSEIMRLTRLQGSCSISNLAQQFSVSEETIRRDIRSLATLGLVKKVHGGVMAPYRLHEAPLQRRMLENQAAKQQIASAITRFIENGDSLMIDTGSTTTYIAQALCHHEDLKVISNSTQITSQLVSYQGNQVYLSGGELRAHDAAAFGPDTIDFFRRFESRVGILSIGAIHASRGIMDHYLCEAELSQTIIENSEQVIVAADASKFDTTALAKVCPLDDIDMLITEQSPPPELAAALKEAEVELHLAIE